MWKLPSSEPTEYTEFALQRGNFIEIPDLTIEAKINHDSTLSRYTVNVKGFSFQRAYIEDPEEIFIVRFMKEKSISIETMNKAITDELRLFPNPDGFRLNITNVPEGTSDVRIVITKAWLKRDGEEDRDYVKILAPRGRVLIFAQSEEHNKKTTTTLVS